MGHMVPGFKYIPANCQEIEVAGVARHVAAHLLLAVHGPRPPRLRLLEAQRAGRGRGEHKVGDGRLSQSSCKTSSNTHLVQFCDVKLLIPGSVSPLYTSTLMEPSLMICW